MILFVKYAVPQLGSFQPLDRSHVASPAALNLSMRRCAVKPLNAEPKRNDLIVPSAATMVAPGMFFYFSPHNYINIHIYRNICMEINSFKSLTI